MPVHNEEAAGGLRRPMGGEVNLRRSYEVNNHATEMTDSSELGLN